MLHQLALPLQMHHVQTLDNFLCSPSNSGAVSWLDLWPTFPLLQMVIYGDSGCGKSHLARAFALRTGGTYILASKTPPPPDAIFKSNPSLLIIDDYDRVDQENWLFHVYNMANEISTNVIYFGRAAPAKHSFTLADLESRMRSIHSIAILTPDENLFKDLLRTRFRGIGLPYPDEVIEFLFRRLERSYEALQSMVDRIDEVSLQQQRSLTLPLLREILGETSEEEGD